jgi:oligoendopeptidase F
MAVVEKRPRKFIPADLNIDSWASIEPFFEHLLGEEPEGLSGLKAWLRDLSELEAFLEEEGAWRYIRMTVDTTDEAAANAYRTFITEIQPKVAPLADQLNRKLASHPFAGELKGDAFRIYLRGIRSAIRLFREANIPLNTELQELAQKYSSITGSMSVEVNGEQLTMQAASARLQSTDRSYREAIYRAVAEVRLKHKDELEQVFDTMVRLRDTVAGNAEYPDYRSYMFASLGRFDYTIQDCIDFHRSIENAIVPLAREISQSRRVKLKLDALRPWDLAVDPEGRDPLKPFGTAAELLTKSVDVFAKVDPFFADCLRSMDELGHFDLASKPGKAPGGYNYPLYESGLPFIFMNAVGTQRDLVTMMHEGGHAVHSVLSHPLELTSFKSCPSEVAELASMSMELISMDHWDVFYTDQAACIRAKREHLEDLLTTLPWIARIDAFQHWIYTNPRHTRHDRAEAWLELGERFDVAEVDWSGFDDARTYSWHRQLHLFEVPFYYIEYGMAQLGAVAVWRNYKQHGSEALEQFKNALALGYTKGIKEIYRTAGIQFDFTPSYLEELAEFVQSELAAL